MSISQFMTEVAGGVERLLRATIVDLSEDGCACVAPTEQPDELLLCDILDAGERRAELAIGDLVLVARVTDPSERGIVLGRVGRTNHVTAPKPKGDAETPDELVIEAAKGLTLKCGEGSITIRADGKILIKGKDLVSHAQRTNRIKGGSVAIN